MNHIQEIMESRKNEIVSENIAVNLNHLLDYISAITCNKDFESLCLSSDIKCLKNPNTTFQENSHLRYYDNLTDKEFKKIENQVNQIKQFFGPGDYTIDPAKMYCDLNYHLLEAENIIRKFLIYQELENTLKKQNNFLPKD